MLHVEGLYKSYGPDIVLNNISFSLSRNMRVGLIGANGVGKSTLIKIIAGQETADSGQIVITRGEKTGYLPQVLPDFSGKTIDNLIDEACRDIRELEIRLRETERKMGPAEGGALDALLTEYGELTQKYEESGAYDLQHRIEMVFDGLRIGGLVRTRTLETLSGGEKTRLGLATVLLSSADLLLLDEPTNHLDTAYLGWLESYLNNFRGAVMISSHDRQLLNTAVNWIYEIDEHSHTLVKYAGNYDACRQVKEQEKLKQEEAWQEQQEEIKELRRTIRMHRMESNRALKPRDNDKFAIHFKKERLQTGAARGISSAKERLDRILADPIPQPLQPLRFRAGFKPEAIKSAEVIGVINLSKGYNGKTLFHDLSFDIGAGTRAVITGPNGSGKTTLLRILAGLETPDTGSVSRSPSLKLGYLPQEFTQYSGTALKYYTEGRLGSLEDLTAELLQSGLLRYDDLSKNTGQLSPGQRRKLDIARMMALEPNALLLDEPTNYISLDDLEAFEAALKDFPGPVLAVSHDRRFIRQSRGEVWELSGGKLTVDKTFP